MPQKKGGQQEYVTRQPVYHLHLHHCSRQRIYTSNPVFVLPRLRNPGNWGTTACELRFHFSYSKYLTIISTIPCPLAGCNESQNDHDEPWITIHDRIKPSRVKITKLKILDPIKELTASRSDFAFDLVPNQLKVSAGINKNLILSKYQEFCIKRGYNDQVYTVVKGKTSQITAYPTHHRLIADCKMKPSTNLYYQVKNLHFDNVVIFLMKWHELYLTDEDLDNLRNLSKMYPEMIDNVLRLRYMDFSNTKTPKI